MITVFDLDGTLSDPAVGITKSINYALEKLDFPKKDTKTLYKYIGPNLNLIFKDLLGRDDNELIDTAVQFFRERYYSVGYRENELYEGIIDILDTLLIGFSNCVA